MSEFHKAIIAGGRDYSVGPNQRHWLDGINAVYDIQEVVCGGAPGADRGGQLWAADRDIPVKVYKADWDTHGKAAGPKRNKEMAKYCEHSDLNFLPNLCILFPGGRGTASMKKLAQDYGLIVIEYKDLESGE